MVRKGSLFLHAPTPAATADPSPRPRQGSQAVAWSTAGGVASSEAVDRCRRCRPWPSLLPVAGARGRGLLVVVH